MERKKKECFRCCRKTISTKLVVCEEANHWLCIYYVLITPQPQPPNTHSLSKTLYTHTNMEPKGNGRKAAETAVSLLPGGSVTESHFRN